MEIYTTNLPGVKIIEPKVYHDNRGYFLESYNQKIFEANGVFDIFVQDNHSCSSNIGVIRGLHYQLEPYAQTKLVRVTAGSIFDVVVDIRRGSPTFGQWEAFELSAKNKKLLLVPRGFAHGFCTLEPNTEVQYKVDESYAAAYDRGIAWNDPTIGIEWPKVQPILSEKDNQLPGLDQAEINFTYKG